MTHMLEEDDLPFLRNQRYRPRKNLSFRPCLKQARQNPVLLCFDAENLLWNKVVSRKDMRFVLRRLKNSILATD